jgi:hypothetical protein
MRKLIIAIIAALTMQPALAQQVNCHYWGELAENIMMSRQIDVPLIMTMDKYQHVGRMLVLAAYAEPKKPTTKEQLQIVSKFGAEAFKKCLAERQ